MEQKVVSVKSAAVSKLVLTTGNTSVVKVLFLIERLSLLDMF